MLLWFRNDLRLDDNPALAAAIASGRPVVPAYIWAPEEEGDWPPGAASRWWLHHALADLDAALRARGSRLTIRRGPTFEALGSLLRETGARGVVWNRRHEPTVAARDSALLSRLRAEGVGADSFNAALLNEPQTLASGSGRAYQVYTPYARAAMQRPVEAPLNTDFDAWRHPPRFPESLPLDALGLLPRLPWAGGLARAWQPDRAGLAARLARLRATVAAYDTARDAFGEDGTSRLSPYLHFGQVGPRQLMALLDGLPDGEGPRRFVAELYWREFAHHVLHHFPRLPTLPLRPEFQRFPWRSDAALLRAWREGRTGYPAVDAGMRQLWESGWMHNRLRMITGSFLVKHLLQPWQDGARWFWDTLVDADLANNTLGWQWVAGCGPDAAPYFRIFNPVAQGQRFDPQGRCIRRHVPELALLPDDAIHEPWKMADLVPAYPPPLVDHPIARARALESYKMVKIQP